MKPLKGNEACIYSYYGWGVLRCSYCGQEGCICIGKNNCDNFQYSQLELD